MDELLSDMYSDFPEEWNNFYEDSWADPAEEEWVDSDLFFDGHDSYSDAEALASAGHGNDEDYGYYGE